MYSFINALPVRRLLGEQVPAVSASLLVAESFYHLHSFMLEAAAFLATWYVFDLIIVRAIRPLIDGRAAARVVEPRPTGNQ